MSHSSGIGVSRELRENFGSAITNTNIRLFKVQIIEEEAREILSLPSQGDWNEDLSLIPSLLDKEIPCYILYRIESGWALFCYVPDKSKVKEKMLYASTRSNLKQQLGSNYFTDEVFGTVPYDFSEEGYKLHRTSKKTEAPLTEQERMKKSELESGEIYTGGQSMYIHGVAFPIDNKATNAVKELLNGKVNYTRIAIDCDAEKIICDYSGNMSSFESLRNEVSTEEPRFHFYAYKHNFEGKPLTSYIYIYSCPDGSNGTKSAPVRMRMLYSSSKANVAEIVTALQGKIDARLEINAPSDLNEEELLTILHPQKEEKKARFCKTYKTWSR